MSGAKLSFMPVKCEGAGVPTVCLSATERGTDLFEAKGLETITDTKAIQSWLVKVPAVGLEVVCKEANGTGTIDQSEPLVKAYEWTDLKLTFSQCAVEGTHAAECKVVEPIKTRGLAATLLSEKELDAKPETGEVFTEIEIGNKTGTCPATIKGINPVKGRQKCTLPKNTEAVKVTDVACAATGSSLKVGSNTTTLEGEASYELTAETFADSVLA